MIKSHHGSNPFSARFLYEDKTAKECKAFQNYFQISKSYDAKEKPCLSIIQNIMPKEFSTSEVTKYTAG